MILVIEDEAELRLLLQKALLDEYEVLTANDGREGLEMAVRHVPDLVITDVRMPGMSGLELCAELVANPKTQHIPVVMMTGGGKEYDQFKGLEVGASDYINKPFSLPVLKMRVRNLLKSRRLYRTHLLSQMGDDAGADAAPADDRFMDLMVEKVSLHLSDPEFGVEQLAEKLNMSKRTFQRKFKALTGKTPRNTIRSIRLKRARDLLENSSLSIAEVAFQVGFEEPTNFNRSFKNQFGFSPSRLRKGDLEKSSDRGGGAEGAENPPA
ncbi:MAG: helix-turn-helix domain-containing protein [Luteolibacter sp.]